MTVISLFPLFQLKQMKTVKIHQQMNVLRHKVLFLCPPNGKEFLDEEEGASATMSREFNIDISKNDLTVCNVHSLFIVFLFSTQA